MINYNDLDIIVDSQGFPVSQYFSEEHGEFAVETTDGSLVLRSDVNFRLKTLILDRDGFPLPQLWDPELQKFVPRTKSNVGGEFDGDLSKEDIISTLGIVPISLSDVKWSNLSGKPNTFTPSTHTHNYVDLIGAPDVGENLEISNEGVISIKNASTNNKGVVQLSDSINSSSKTTAATSNAVKTVNDNLNTHTNNKATTSALGHVKPDGTTIKIDSNGVISAVTSSGGEQSLAERFNIKADGVTNNAQNLQNAIDYLHGLGGGVLELPSGIIKTGFITVKTNVTLTSKNKNSTLLINQTPAVRLESKATLKGITVKGDSDSYIGDWQGAVQFMNGSMQTVDSCEFKNLYTCVYNQSASNYTVKDSVFSCDADDGYGFYGEVNNHATIKGNHFNCVGSDSRPICFQFFAVNNTIQNNTIIGNGKAITGILFMNHFDAYNAAVYGNRILDNYVSGVTEEGISFDMMMESEKAEDRWTGGSVTSASMNIFSDSLVDSSANWWPGDFYLRYLLITKGKGEGQIRQITSNTATSLTIDRPWSVLPDSTSKYIIGNFGFDNIISRNTVEDCGRQGILLYGTNLNSQITENNVKNSGFNEDKNVYPYSGIGIVSCEANEIRRYRPALFNTIANNVVSQCVTGIVVSSAPWSGTYTPVMLPGGTVIHGNIVNDLTNGIVVREGKDSVIQSNIVNNSETSISLGSNTNNVKCINNITNVNVVNTGSDNVVA